MLRGRRWQYLVAAALAAMLWFALAGRPPAPVRADGVPLGTPDTAGQVVGQRAPRFRARLADGTRLSLPDGRRSVALWLGAPAAADNAAAGLSQLAAAWPEVRFVVATVPPRPSRGASAKPSAQPSAAAATPGVGRLVGRPAEELWRGLAELLGGHQRQPAEWWLIDAAGRVTNFGDGRGAPALMEAELIWPLLRDKTERASAASPTPIASLRAAEHTAAWRERLLVGWRRWLLDGYQAYGHHDAAWDEPARALLEARCRQLAGHPSRAGTVAVAELADFVLATACDDPLVLSECALGLAADLESTRAARVFRRLPELAKVGTYPPRLRWLVSMAAQRPIIDAPGLPCDESDRLLGEALAGPWSAYEPRLAAQVLMEAGPLVTNSQDPDQRQQVLDRALANGAGQLGLRAWLDGVRLVARAYTKRGMDIAARTTATRQEAFELHLDSAERALALAQRLLPDQPEPALWLVSLNQGRGDQPAVRRYAEQALATDAELDASSRLLTAMWPRWGGSHEAMQTLADDLSEASLLDTEAPLTQWRLRESLAGEAYMSIDGSYDWQASEQTLAEADGLDRVLATLSAMIGRADTPGRRARLRTYRTAVLLRAGRGDQARAAWRECRAEADLGAMGHSDAALLRRLSSWANDEPLGDGGRTAALALLDAGRPDEALARYHRALNLDQPPIVRRWLRDGLSWMDGHLAQARNARMADDKRLPGFKPLTLGVGFSGWRVTPPSALDDQVTVEPGGCLAAGPSILMISTESLPANVELAFEAQVVATQPAAARFALTDEATAKVGAVVVTGLAGAVALHSDHRFGLGYDPSAPTTALEPRAWHTVRLRMRNGHAEVAVDGRPAQPAGDVSAHRWCLWVWSATKPADAVTRIRAMQWRPL